MDFPERKDKIIAYLKEFSSINNHEAQALTKAHRNTITSDFQNLIEEKIIVSKGKGKGTRYELSENQIFTEEEINSLFTKNMQTELDRYFLKQARNKIFFNKTHEAASEADFSFSQQILDNFNKMGELIKDKRKNLSEFERKRKKEKLTIDLSWASSNIEGNTYSRLETETLIKYSETADGKKVEEAEMILNHKDALEYIRTTKNYSELNKTKVLELHQLLIKNLNIDTGFRKHLVAISNSSFVPCDNQFEIISFFEQIIEKINGVRCVLEKVAMANLLLAFLQPFSDGNKRTSRMLGNAILLSYEYLPISFSHIPKDDYIKAIIYFYEKQNPNYFKKLLLKELNHSFKEYIE